MRIVVKLVHRLWSVKLFLDQLQRLLVVSLGGHVVCEQEGVCGYLA